MLKNLKNRTASTEIEYGILFKKWIKIKAFQNIVAILKIILLILGFLFLYVQLWGFVVVAY